MTNLDAEQEEQRTNNRRLYRMIWFGLVVAFASMPILVDYMRNSHLTLTNSQWLILFGVDVVEYLVFVGIGVVLAVSLANSTGNLWRKAAWILLFSIAGVTVIALKSTWIEQWVGAVLKDSSAACTTGLAVGYCFIDRTSKERKKTS